MTQPTCLLQEVPLEDFVRRPIGCCYAGPSYLGWALSPTLSGGAVWGRPTLTDAAAMVRGHDWRLAEGHAPPVDVLLDLSALEHISAELFAFYVKQVVPQVPTFAQFIRRQALVVPEGMVGSIVAGFYPMLGLACPRYRVFRTPVEAFAWLGHPENTARAVSALVEGRRRAPSTQRRLRTLLAADCTLDIEAAAKALCTSARSLQRDLNAEGTSFRTAQAEAKLEAARSLLRGERVKLWSVARTLGMASPSHFAAWFRRHTGATPARWRAGPDARPPDLA